MAISGGIDWVATQAAIWQWVVNGTGLPGTSVVWGQQVNSPRPPQPAVTMRLSTVDSTTNIGKPWLDVVDQPLVVPVLTVTAVVGNNLTITAHGLVTGDGPVRVASTGTLPSPLLAGTDYWVIVVDANTVRLAATFAATGGAPPNTNPQTPITLTSSGSGTITLFGTASTVRAGHEIQHLSRELVKLCLTLECYTSVGVGMDMATSILRRVASRRVLPSQVDLLQGANIGLTSVERVRALHGVQDALLFEPRAMVEVYLDVPSEEAEDSTFINSADVTDQDTGRTFHITRG